MNVRERAFLGSAGRVLVAPAAFAAFLASFCLGLALAGCAGATTEPPGGGMSTSLGGSPGTAGPSSSTGGQPATGAGGAAPGSGGVTSDASTPGQGGSNSSGGCTGGTTLCGTQCHNLSSEAANCGSCGHGCAAGQVCTNGTCGCAAGQTSCGGTCVSTASDAKNCGACGTVCGTGLVCSQGKCSSGCAGALTLCGSSCVDTMNSSANCGGCGKSCPTDQSCWLGGCRCATGLGPCGANGQCIDVLSSLTNCGTCGTACVTGQGCNAGVCQCPPFQSVCGSSCRDLYTDVTNCGTCGTRCAAGTQCLFGGCIDPASVSCGGGAQMGMTCTQNANILQGKYYVNNNWWGVGTGVTGGPQCVWGTCQTGDLVGWGTSWTNWGGTGGVKTYASLVFGWHYGVKVPNTGLPVQVSSSRQINCGWSFNMTTTGTFNVAYDIWLHSSDVVTNPSNTTPNEEVMIWLASNGGAAPIGPTVASNVSLAGTTWDLHEGPGGASWRVASYVRTRNATTAVMNLMEFFKDLASRGLIPNTWFVSGIEAGSEVFNGTGQLDTNGFYCRVQ